MEEEDRDGACESEVEAVAKVEHSVEMLPPPDPKHQLGVHHCGN